MTLKDILTDFIWENCTYLHKKNRKEDLEREIVNDLKYDHIVFTSDDRGLTGVCRFSIKGDTTRILDVAIRKDKRNNGVLSELLQHGLKLYPKVKKLNFHSMAWQREFTIPASLFLLKEN